MIFPAFCHKIRIISGFQFYNKAIILWLGIGLLLGFFITIGSFVNDYQAYLLALRTIWWIGGTGFCFCFISAILFIYSWSTYYSYNKKYLPALKSLFIKMQTEGYIGKDLTKYPESLQMAFWPYHWYDWNRN